MLHLEGHHEGINNGALLQGMKSYPVQFNRIPYYEHLEIVHFFDTMHIGNNLIGTLWRILDGSSDRKNCQDL